MQPFTKVDTKHLNTPAYVMQLGFILLLKRQGFVESVKVPEPTTNHETDTLDTFDQIPEHALSDLG